MGQACCGQRKELGVTENLSFDQPGPPPDLRDTDFAFLMEWRGITDTGALQALKAEVIAAWLDVKKAAHVYRCIQTLSFLKCRAREHPGYQDLLKVAKQRGGWCSGQGLVADVGAALGQDSRALLLDGVPADKLVIGDVGPVYWEAGLRIFGEGKVSLAGARLLWGDWARPLAGAEGAPEAEAGATGAAKASSSGGSSGVREVDSRCTVAGLKVIGNYSAVLNQTNVSMNNHKFYIIQALEGGGRFYAWSRWGRVGEDGCNKLSTCATAEEAINEFQKKFTEKTENEWAKRANFVAKEGKYTLVEVGDAAGGGEDQAPRQLPPDDPAADLDGRLSGVLCTAVLHVLSREQSANLLERLARCLQPGGLLLGSCVGSTVACEWAKTPDGRAPRWLHSAESLQEQLRAAGFTGRVEVQAQGLAEFTLARSSGPLDDLPAHQGEKRLVVFTASR